MERLRVNPSGTEDNMILTRKYQCQMCRHFGSIKGLDGFCCITLDKDDWRRPPNDDKIPKRSSCWCSGQEPNGVKPQKRWLPFLELGKYLTERYGYDTVLIPGTWNEDPTWRVRITNERLIFPLEVAFSIAPQKGVYTVEDLKRILKAHEREDNNNNNNEQEGQKA